MAQQKPSGPKMVDCPQCASKTSEAGKFCLNCGKPLKKVCANCSSDVANTKHCAVCGADLQTVASNPKPKRHGLEVTAAGSDGQYRLRVQATEDELGFKSRVWIGAQNVFAVVDHNRNIIVGKAVVVSKDKTNINYFMGLESQIGVAVCDFVANSVFETDDGFLECLIDFSSPLLEIAFGLVGSNADIIERILTGPNKAPLIPSGSFAEAKKVAMEFNRGKRIKR